jgi:hypothetical protein
MTLLTYDSGRVRKSRNAGTWHVGPILHVTGDDVPCVGMCVGTCLAMCGKCFVNSARGRTSFVNSARGSHATPHVGTCLANSGTCRHAFRRPQRLRVHASQTRYVPRCHVPHVGTCFGTCPPVTARMSQTLAPGVRLGTYLGDVRTHHRATSTVMPCLRGEISMAASCMPARFPESRSTLPGLEKNVRSPIGTVRSPRRPRCRTAGISRWMCARITKIAGSTACPRC